LQHPLDAPVGARPFSGCFTGLTNTEWARWFAKKVNASVMGALPAQSTSAENTDIQ